MKTDCLLATPLVSTPPLAQCEVCVIVPVRNEAEVLADTLAALARQVDLQGRRFCPDRYEVILLLNNCTDESATIAQSFTDQLTLHLVDRTLPESEAYIGRVRQLLMDEAYRRLMSIDRRLGIIASTDGDTQVAPNWIAATQAEIAQGADAVGGRIVTDAQGRAALDPYARSCHLREVGYRYLIAELESYLDADPHDRFPRHYQHYGASLAVTAQMYAQAGGMPPVRTPEDVAFYQALMRVGARFRHSPQVRATTSARPIGRTNIGLANQLQEWTLMGQRQQSFLVESAPSIEARFRARHALRRVWHQHWQGYAVNLFNVANLLDVSAHWLRQNLVQSPSFGTLYERVEQRQEGWHQESLVPIEQAIFDLRLRLEKLRRGQSLCRCQPCRELQSLRFEVKPTAKPVQTNPVGTAFAADRLDAAV